MARSDISGVAAKSLSPEPHAEPRSTYNSRPARLCTRSACQWERARWERTAASLANAVGHVACVGAQECVCVGGGGGGEGLRLSTWIARPGLWCP